MNVKTDVTLVTKRGQTSIPAHLRKELHLERGGRLVWERVSTEEIRVRVLRDAPAPLAMLGFAKRFRRARRTAAWMAELRAAEK